MLQKNEENFIFTLRKIGKLFAGIVEHHFITGVKKSEGDKILFYMAYDAHLIQGMREEPVLKIHYGFPRSLEIAEKKNF